MSFLTLHDFNSFLSGGEAKTRLMVVLLPFIDHIIEPSESKKSRKCTL
jgi:hypothetical protein